MVIFDIWKCYEKVNEMTLDIQFYCVYITLKKTWVVWSWLVKNEQIQFLV